RPRRCGRCRYAGARRRRPRCPSERASFALISGSARRRQIEAGAEATRQRLKAEALGRACGLRPALAEGPGGLPGLGARGYPPTRLPPPSPPGGKLEPRAWRSRLDRCAVLDQQAQQLVRGEAGDLVVVENLEVADGLGGTLAGYAVDLVGKEAEAREPFLDLGDEGRIRRSLTVIGGGVWNGLGGGRGWRQRAELGGETLRGGQAGRSCRGRIDLALSAG